MEDAPERLFLARRNEIAQRVHEILKEECGGVPRFMLSVVFDSGPGLCVGNITPDSMRVLAENMITGLHAPGGSVQ